MLQKYYGHSLDADIMEIYWQRLQWITEEAFKKAATVILETFKPTTAVPFPVIAHFLEACGMAGETQERNIIAVVKKAITRHGRYSSVDFNDTALHETITRYGGWPELCSWSEDTWAMREKAFLAAYRSAKAFNQGPAYLPGIFEQTNSLHASQYENKVEKIENITPGTIPQGEKEKLLS
jgi:hypothetical protein